MTDILDLPDWTLLAKRSAGDEYGIPVSMVGVGTLIEFWERKD